LLFYSQWHICITGGICGCTARHSTLQKWKTEEEEEKKKKKKESTLRKNLVVFKGNMTAKTCLINNKDCIASQILPLLEHLNENTEHVLCKGKG